MSIERIPFTKRIDGQLVAYEMVLDNGVKVAESRVQPRNLLQALSKESNDLMVTFLNSAVPEVKKVVVDALTAAPVPEAEPVVEPVVEPAAEPVVEPAAEPVVEPAAEPVPEPVVEPDLEDFMTQEQILERTQKIQASIAEQHVKAHADVAASQKSIDDYVDGLKANGVVIEKDGPTTIIKSIPASEQELFKFFTDTPCWFAGCEDLRKAYEAEIEDAGGESCTGCQKGAITRKYVPQVRALLKTHYKDNIIDV
jgi:hypothetical protein